MRGPALAAPRPTVAVGGIAVVDGALLLVQRARPPQVGHWTVPGGRMEPGESVAQAVERELWEETALKVRCGALVGFTERRGPDYHYVILDFRVTPIGAAIPRAGSDAAAVAWVALDEVRGLNLVDGLEEFLVGHGVMA